MIKPKRNDDKYWEGTRNFNHIQFESDLEDYIDSMELKINSIQEVINETEQENRHKEPGKPETYSKYNEGWSDALDVLGERILNKLNQ